MKKSYNQKRVTRKARCKKVIAIINNELLTLDLTKEYWYPNNSEFADTEEYGYAVVEYNNGSVDREHLVPIEMVVFLK